MKQKYMRSGLKFVMSCIFGICIFLINANIHAGEVEIGEKEIMGGVEFIFEAAPADTINPSSMHLPADETEAHLEVKAIFESSNNFASAPGGFVPYLNVNVRINNRVTGESLHITLTPHLNLIDGFHYGRNVNLPGNPISDSYDLTYFIDPPGEFVVQIHSDFRTEVGDSIIEKQVFTFENVNLADLFTGEGSGNGT